MLRPTSTIRTSQNRSRAREISRVALTVRTAPRAMQPVRLLDGSRVELQRVFRIQSSRRLGHASESKALLRTATAILGRRMDVLAASSARGAGHRRPPHCGGIGGLGRGLAARSPTRQPRRAAGADVAVVRVADPGGDLRLPARRRRAVARRWQPSSQARSSPRSSFLGDEGSDRRRSPWPYAGRRQAGCTPDVVCLLPVVDRRASARQPRGCSRSREPFGLDEHDAGAVVAAQHLARAPRVRDTATAPTWRMLRRARAGHCRRRPRRPVRTRHRVAEQDHAPRRRGDGRARRRSSGYDGRARARSEPLASGPGPSTHAAESGPVARRALERAVRSARCPRDETFRRRPASRSAREPPVGVLQLVLLRADAAVEADARPARQLRPFEPPTPCAPASARSAMSPSSSARRHCWPLSARRSPSSRLRTRSRPPSTRVTELLRVGSHRRLPARPGTAEAAERGGLDGPQLAVAERLLELSLGPLRAQGMLHVDRRCRPTCGSQRCAMPSRKRGIEAVLAVPLLVREELIGLLAVYLPRGRELSDERVDAARGARQPARGRGPERSLHERRSGWPRSGSTLSRPSGRRKPPAGALYEISRSFAQSLSLDATLEARRRGRSSSCSRSTRP